VGASRAVRWLPVVAAGLALGAALVWGSRSGAQQTEPAVNIQLHGFTDSRSVTVLSPTVSLDKDFTDRTGLRMRFGVDAISAASDSCIRCHPQGANNARTFLNGALVRKYGDTSLSFGGSSVRRTSIRRRRPWRRRRAR